MNKSLIVLIIDGLGVGAIDKNKSFNTWQTIEENTSKNELKCLKEVISNSRKLFLDYPGADSFLGHLAISGINVNNISLNPLKEYAKRIINILEDENYKVEYRKGIIVVEEKFIVYDNFEADHGLAINIVACLDKVSFSKIKIVAKKIRTIIKNSRLIAFGAKNISIDNLLSKYVANDPFYGIKTPETGIYNDTFIVEHFPLKLDFSNSIQNIALKNGWKVFMYGKFGDIIKFKNKNLFYFKSIDPQKIFDSVINNKNDESIHFINIQQTDLAGHEGNIEKYIKVLKVIDKNLKRFINKEYKIILSSDHGNDPAIKDGKHTREYVPLWTLGLDNGVLEIKNLSDIKKIISHYININIK